MGKKKPTLPTKALLNLNDRVQVTLTEKGRQTFISEYMRRSTDVAQSEVVVRILKSHSVGGSNRNTFEFQLWELFAWFGASMPHVATLDTDALPLLPEMRLIKS